jgi:FdhD protein
LLPAHQPATAECFKKAYLDNAMNQRLQQPQTAVSAAADAVKQHYRIDPFRLICIAEETPVAFRYDGFSHAVMMATPDDLEDFAMGFSRSEGIIEKPSDLRSIAVHNSNDGITLDISLDGNSLHRYLAGRRVRQLRGHTSCGLCGVEDLHDVRRPAINVVPAIAPGANAIVSALESLRARQPLSRDTRGAHASAWVTLEGALCTVREDVGRHNSLDKLIGALLRSENPIEGFCLITSRCSFEMVQKAVTAGFATLVSAGMPTALAVRYAAAARLRLYSLSRQGEPLQFTSPVALDEKI